MLWRICVFESDTIGSTDIPSSSEWLNQIPSCSSSSRFSDRLPSNPLHITFFFLLLFLYFFFFFFLFDDLLLLPPVSSTQSALHNRGLSKEGWVNGERTLDSPDRPLAHQTLPHHPHHSQGVWYCRVYNPSNPSHYTWYQHKSRCPASSNWDTLHIIWASVGEIYPLQDVSLDFTHTRSTWNPCGIG